MRKIKYCLEASGLGEDKEGSPFNVGISLTLKLKKPIKEIKYSELIKGICPKMMLTGLVVFNDLFDNRLSDVRFIAPEEFEARYAEGEDEE